MVQKPTGKRQNPDVDASPVIDTPEHRGAGWPFPDEQPTITNRRYNRTLPLLESQRASKIWSPFCYSEPASHLRCAGGGRYGQAKR